jgi:hypothetical protein
MPNQSACRRGTNTSRARTAAWSGLLALVFAAGCSSPGDFVEVRPGVSVSSRLIDEYAEAHGLSRKEAAAQMATQMTGPEALQK